MLPDPLLPDAVAAADLALARAGEHCQILEDDVLTIVAILGEPRVQRVVDDWLDQVTDTLRAIGEATGQGRRALPRVPPGGSQHRGLSPQQADPTPSRTGR